jgi:spermidine/putrescine transport system ATP-binding protein
MITLSLQMNDTVLDIKNVTKRFGSVTAVQNVSLQIQRGEFFSLLGPSGCGKTTLLRMIAGFEEITEGQILIHGQDIAPLPAYKRPVNTVFQHYSLFPHMNVFQNISFGLERKNSAKEKIEATVKEALDLVQLSGFEKRRPSQLSGGQKQRVALARALVMQPEVLLLDEPLGALDMKLRKEMQVELKNLQEQLKITFIFVTHDQEEALVMSDRIAVMSQGHIEQVGKSCSEIYEHPRTEFVANFIGATNIFEGTVHDHVLKMANGPEFPVDSAPHQGPVKFTVRPEKMQLSPQEVSGRISLSVTVTDEIFQGTNTSWVVEYHGQKYTVIEQNSKAVEEQGRFSRGDQALLSWDPRHTVILEKVES